ncbi:hypothetical protein HNP46_000172 [Pseudomonas nitritireducens]|uniref:Uncharacterized protein n=1 Tax=Pseudomonas nitroreducens TaxID=46680 RepID=A0A7W7KFB2_PSENT|nr:hypothetical protein [Pseudomonas nitritireducens]MBB4861361.1 hypothetical protein [Pseudomonas nitritireducens]
MVDTWRNAAVHIPTEDKEKWCKEGEEYERKFVECMNKYSDIQVQINPKKQRDKYAPDLLVPGYGECDLKAQRTPFFTAAKFGIHPRNAFTLNEKDVIRYRQMYPGIGIFFWVDWQNRESKGRNYKPVEYKWGVYYATIREILGIIDTGLAKLHSYQHRQDSAEHATRNKRGMNDDGNAKGSYVLSVEWITPILFSKDDPWV